MDAGIQEVVIVASPMKGIDDGVCLLRLLRLRLIRLIRLMFSNLFSLFCLGFKKEANEEKNRTTNPLTA